MPEQNNSVIIRGSSALPKWVSSKVFKKYTLLDYCLLADGSMVINRASPLSDGVYMTLNVTERAKRNSM